MITIRSDRTGTITGTAQRRAAGHWTAYSYTRGMGSGPLLDDRAAVAWVRRMDRPVTAYSR